MPRAHARHDRLRRPPPSAPPTLLDPWVWRMAWRDSRRSRGRLLVFSTALTLGVAALVAIGSLGWNLQRAIHEQARTLVGADLVLEGTTPPDAGREALIGAFGPIARADETRLASMSTFPKSGGSRLTQVRAIAGTYPFYGHIEADPPLAASDFAAGKGALVEESLLLQYGGKPGDPIQIGGVNIPILGAIRKLPGDASAFASIAPRVLIPRDRLSPSLLSRGSLARYLTYLKLPADADVPKLSRPTPEGNRRAPPRNRHRRAPRIPAWPRVHGREPLPQPRRLHRAAARRHRRGERDPRAPQNEAAHRRRAALPRGVRRDKPSRSISSKRLRSGWSARSAAQSWDSCCKVSRQFSYRGSCRWKSHFGISWLAVIEGMGVGFLTCALFVLLPLLPVRRTPPLLALRAAFEPSADRDRAPDPLRWLAWVLLAAALLLFPWLQSRDPYLGFGFSAGLFVAFGLLALTAYGLMTAARRFFPQSWPFEWRQGLANLYRPNNRTLVLVFTLGLSTFLLLGMYLTKDILLRQFDTKENAANQPNLVFFDIQTDQKDAVAAAVRAEGLPVMGMVPTVVMRLSSIQGLPIDVLAARNGAIRRSPAGGCVTITARPTATT